MSKPGSNKIDLAITGAAGQHGCALIALAQAGRRTFRIVGAIERPDHPQLSRDAGEIAGIGSIGTPLTFDLRPTPAVLIDFSSPDSMRHWLKTCRDRGIAMVIGTTGLGDADHATIDQAARDIAVLQAPNMSLGVNLMFKVAAEMAKRLGDDYDIEIVERTTASRRTPPPAPPPVWRTRSSKSTGKKKSSLVHGRKGDEALRKRGDVGIHSLRLGDEVGRHTAYFAALGERLELTHVATMRDTFARGALRAAKWLAARSPAATRWATSWDFERHW